MSSQLKLETHHLHSIFAQDGHFCQACCFCRLRYFFRKLTAGARAIELRHLRDSNPGNLFPKSRKRQLFMKPSAADFVLCCAGLLKKHLDACRRLSISQHLRRSLPLVSKLLLPSIEQLQTVEGIADADALQQLVCEG